MRQPGALRELKPERPFFCLEVDGRADVVLAEAETSFASESVAAPSPPLGPAVGFCPTAHASVFETTESAYDGVPSALYCFIKAASVMQSESLFTCKFCVSSSSFILRIEAVCSTQGILDEVGSHLHQIKSPRRSAVFQQRHGGAAQNPLYDCTAAAVPCRRMFTGE